jgi:asparagine synthase (glutamine-hydrolysing)
MCGLAGLLRLDGAPARQEELEAMGAAIAHRGPDGTGVLLQGPLGFAHRRLSIIDLATGDQPMERRDLGRSVIFNGEIYNYLELREELLALGQRFDTRSDTEVLLAGHAQWGDGLLPRLRGMFAFALWEAGKQRLLLARDPLGKKPLQLTFAPGKLCAFASEARALFALPEVSRAVEPAAMAAYLEWMYVPEQLNVFREVERVQPGEAVVVERGRLTRSRFRADTKAAPQEGRSFEDACAQVEERLKRAVQLRLRSDVPLGVFLSGGIDSSLVALYAAQLSGAKLRTFTVGFPGPGDERSFAREIARKLGTEHTEVTLELDAPALAREVAESWDEPFGDSSAVPVLAMSRETRKQVKVVLGGDGGDEVFGGYDSYLRHVRAGSTAGAPGLLRRRAAALVARLKDGARRLPAPLAARLAALARPYRARIDSAADAQAADPALRHLRLMRVAHSAPPEELLRPLLAGRPLPEASLLALAGPADAPFPGGALRAAMQVDRRIYLPGDILKKVDIASMRHGLEVRAPLLDDDLIALADALPIEHLVQRLAGRPETAWNKRPLKALAARAYGEEFAYRPKQGFAAPLQEWLDDPRFVAMAEDGFASSNTPLKPWFEKDALPRVWREWRAGKRWLAQEVWNLIMLDGWARAVRPS